MKTAIITGASSGLGSEFVRQLADVFPEIQCCWLIARRRDRLEKLAQALLERETLTYKEVVALLGLPDKDAAVEVAPGEIAPGEASGSDCVEPEAETGSVPAESAE